MTKPLLGVHLCLLEDSADEGELLKLSLERRGACVTWVQTVRDAKAQLESTAFDALISDLTLPDGGGLSVARDLASARPQLTLIALSGHASQSAVAASREAGFAAHFGKPVDLAALVAWIVERISARPRS